MAFGWFKKKKKSKTPPSKAKPKWDMAKNFKEAQKKNKKINAKKPVKKPCAKCEAKKQEVKLVEFIEVVTLDKEGSVVSPGRSSRKYKRVFRRRKKDGRYYKQYINFGKDVDAAKAVGTDPKKRRPDCDQYIELRARVTWVRGNKKRSLAGKTVYFSSKLTEGPDGRPASLTGDDDYGFGSAGGTKDKYTATTGKDGWTGVVKFYLSKYGGDKFELTAQADEKNKSKPSGRKITIGKYIVWRKFWYQLTYAKGYAAKKPASSRGAYKAVCAEMTYVNKVVFQKARLAAGVRSRTFYPEYMVKKGAGTNEVAVIGTHNVATFKAMLTREKSHPVKTNLIVCEYQCDPAAQAAPASLFKMTSKSRVITVSSGGGGSIITKPAMTAGASVVTGKYGRLVGGSFVPVGDITDANIAIEHGRATTKTVKVTLPGGVTAPTPAAPLWLKLKFQTAASFLGWATERQVVCVYRPSAAAGKSGSKVDYNDTVTHEFGHLFNQTPEPAQEPESMNVHPKQYLGHGGSGSHCAQGSPNMPASQADRQKTAKTEPNINAGAGACVMFASGTAHCIHKYCATCKPYVRLQDMSGFS